MVLLLVLLFLQWGTVDTEIKIPSAENPELTNIFPLKPGVGQNIATQALPTARNFFTVLIFTFLIHLFQMLPTF